MTDDAEDRLVEGIHTLVCDMDEKELAALRTRYADNPAGWLTIERARALTPPDCRCASHLRDAAMLHDAAMHPNGRCLCQGEGMCLWCQTTGAAE